MITIRNLRKSYGSNHVLHGIDMDVKAGEFVVMLGLSGKLQADAADALAVAITHAHVRASAQRLGVAARTAWARKGRGWR